MIIPNRSPRFLRRAAATLALVASLADCGSGVGRSSASVDPVVSSCDATSLGDPMRDTVVVALAGPLRPGEAQVQPSPAEGFLIAHLSSDTACGSYRIASGDPLVLVPLEPGRSGPTLLLQVTAPGADPRDLIDRGADVVITSDPVALEYARSRADLQMVPLAWAVTYALVSPPGSPLPIDTSAVLRADLARDAVRAEARPAAPLEWRRGEARCTIKWAAPPTRLPGIAIPEDDAVARGLAERLVALATIAGPRRVIPSAARVLDALLANGSAVAYILPFPRFPPADCAGVPRVPEGWEVTPLIDVRGTAVLRSGVPPFLIHPEGTIRFVSRGPR